MDNMKYYNIGRKVPIEAQKSFTNGRFSGTDINPMWRIQMLTEMFGPCGIGWYTEIVNEHMETGVDGEIVCLMDVNLYIRNLETNEFSKPIYGTGGNKFVALEKGALRTNDEARKMAYTDAVSICCKSLGIGADVWFKRGQSKYVNFEDDPEKIPKEDGKESFATKEQVEQIIALTTDEQRKTLLESEQVGAFDELTIERADALLTQLNRWQQKKGK